MQGAVDGYSHRAMDTQHLLTTMRECPLFGNRCRLQRIKRRTYTLVNELQDLADAP